MLGVPTLAIHTRAVFSPVHLGVLRAAFPDADYEVIGADGAPAGLRFVERVAGALP